MCRKISCTQPAHRHIETKKEVNQPTSGTRTFASSTKSKQTFPKEKEELQTTNEDNK